MAEPEVIEAEVEEIAKNLPAVQAHEAIMARSEISVLEAKAQKDKITELMGEVMTEGIHYGKIPGVSKPTLLKPGAEAINVALRLAPDYESEKIWQEEHHLTVSAKCILKHIPTGLVIAAGEGLCSTHEQKYAYRQGKRSCPECGAEAIVRSTRKKAYFCISNEGGCGNRYAFGTEKAQELDAQNTERVPNPDLPDTWNTVLKMADKRALVAAVLNGTAASDVFTQDVEDLGAAASAYVDEPEPEPRRQEGPPPVPVPQDWEGVETLVRSADNPEEAWALFRAFLRAGAHNLFGEVEMDKLERAQKATLFQKAAGAAVWLVENVEHEGPFLFFDQPKQRTAWQHVLNTKDPLPIPDYVPPEPEGVDEDAERIGAEVFAPDADQPAVSE